jgi:uncharacterized protein (TIGR03067 family)
MRVLIAVGVLAVAAVAAPVPKAVKKQSTTDGRWEIEQMTYNGQDITKGNPWVWDIDGQKLTISVRQADKSLKLNDTTVATALVPPARGEPDELDYHRKGGGVNYELRGRIKVEGDELVYVHADPNENAPTEFTTKAKYYYRFKRVTEK